MEYVVICCTNPSALRVRLKRINDKSSIQRVIYKQTPVNSRFKQQTVDSDQQERATTMRMRTRLEQETTTGQVRVPMQEKMKVLES